MIGTSLANLLRVARSVLASPADDLRLTGVVMGVAALIVLIMLFLLLILVTPRQRKMVKVRRKRRRGSEAGKQTAQEALEADEASGRQANAGRRIGARADHLGMEVAPSPSHSPRKTGRRLLSRRSELWLILAAVIAALLSSYYISGSNTYCSSTCHANDSMTSNALRVGHASCTTCHERPGLSSVPSNLLARGRMIVWRVTDSSGDGATVDSRACLRCHSPEMKKTIVSGAIRMSHAEPNAAGFTCTSCHPDAGHSQTRVNTMSRCVVCHDAKAASADCQTCHTSQPLASASAASTGTIGSGKIVYPQVELPAKQCGGCHDQAKQCDTCHGLRMPHPELFTSGGGHAVAASFEGKDLCFRCHAKGACTRCHSLTGHPADWKQAHKTYPWSSGCGCHTGGCFLCHNRSGSHKVLR